MTGAAVAELWADLIGEPLTHASGPTAANPAKAAKRESGQDLAGDRPACEGLRKPANPDRAEQAADTDSQPFAKIRKPANGPQSEQACGSSQESQNSQGWAGTTPFAPMVRDLSAVAWADAEIAAYLDRRARLLRWGWPETEAERLVKRDREHDERVSCADCAHYRPGRCSNHRRAGLHAADVGRDLAAMLQRCAGFETSKG